MKHLIDCTDRKGAASSVAVLIFMLLMTAASCSQVKPIQSVDRIVENVVVDAPDAPELCKDNTRQLAVPKDDARLYLLVFTEEYCDACARQLHELKVQQDRLKDAKIDVVQAVVATDGSCFDATRMGRTSPFPFAAVTDDQQRNWGVRSTPTSWIINPKTWTTIKYVEGVVTVDELVKLADGTS